MLRKDLLRVSRAGGGYQPTFADRSDRPLAARTIGTYQGHVGETRAALEEALTELEREADDFKLVRGFAALLEREGTFETRAEIPPPRARRTAFEAAETVGVVTEAERERALDRAGDRLGTTANVVEPSLYADRDSNQILTAFESRWDPDTLLEQYNLSLAQTALFDATEIRVQSSDPRAVISAVKRLGLMYEIHRTDHAQTEAETAVSDADSSSAEAATSDGNSAREIVVTGPDAIFQRTRRYGTAFARVLRSVAATADWTLEATIDDRGRERTLRLDDTDVSVPGVEPVAEPTYDSGVEADFAARFEALDLDWELHREPDPLAAGARVMIPDFAFDYRYAPFRLYFEVMGFWTPEYVEKKLQQLADLEDVDMLVAVDESLAAGEAIEARDHRAITYRGTVRLKDVVDVLREYEAEFVDEAAASLPESLTPTADVVDLETLAADHGVAVESLEAKQFPDHERVGRTLVRPDVLEDLEEQLEEGLSFDRAESIVEDAGIDDVSAVFSRLGYRVEWTGLSGGTLREK